jgi:hypothetical protein
VRLRLLVDEPTVAPSATMRRALSRTPGLLETSAAVSAVAWAAVFTGSTVRLR